jgi:hypothetical protein
MGTGKRIRVYSAQLLVHVHGVQQRLIEAGLEIVRDDQMATIKRLSCA